MCGIAGYFNSTGIRPENLEKMNSRLRHRGPDGEGFVWFDEAKAYPTAGPDTPLECHGDALPWLAKSLEKDNRFRGGMAHRRLAILDLEAGGHQPMCSSDKRFWISYNGEIYNHPELKEQLIKAGHRFHTRSDTEVLLAAWMQWGPGCLPRLNGMWAFALYDTQTQKLYASRDRFGVKPFYYFHSGRSFVFASEQKALLENPVVRTGIHEAALFDYFVLGQIEYQSESFFQNILELAPAHYLCWDFKTGDCSVHRYYQLQTQYGTPEQNRISFEEHVQNTRDLLEQAIRIRLRADVEVGTCLSGGLDSSAITGLMRKILSPGREIKTFTSVFPGDPSDESKWADSMAEFSASQSFKVTADAAELLRDLDELSLCQDIPLWSTSTYAQFRVMKMVRDTGIKVVLDGQGGDEVFAGYGLHRYYFQKGLPLQKRWIHLLANGQLPFYLNQYLRQELIYQLPPSLTLFFYKRYFPELNVFNSDFLKRNQERYIQMRKRNPSHLNERLASEMNHSSLKSYLKCEDRCAMWHGVESRTPFADDHPLIDYVFGLGQEYKIRGKLSKFLLRESIKGIVPESIRMRADKMGYATPNNVWINTLAQEMESALLDLPEEFFDRKELRKRYKSLFYPTSQLDNGRIFKFFSFSSWYRVFKNHL